MSVWMKVYPACPKVYDGCDWRCEYIWVSRAKLSDASPLPPTHAEKMAKEMVERKAWCERLSERRAMARNDFDAFCQRIEGIIASMYRKPKEIQAGEASQQLYFTKAAAAYCGITLPYV